MIVILFVVPLALIAVIEVIAVIANYVNKSKTREQSIHDRLIALQEERQFEDDLRNL